MNATNQVNFNEFGHLRGRIRIVAKRRTGAANERSMNMDVQNNGKQPTTPAANLWRAFSLVTIALFATSAYGQATPGESFNALLDANCGPPTPAQLGRVCAEFNADGGSSASGGGVGGNNNLGGLGSQNQTTGDFSERGEIHSYEGWGVFGAVNVGNRQRSATPLENGYNGDVIGGSIGIDKSLSDKFVAGLVLGQRDFEADFDLAAGSVETDTQSVTVFLSYDHSETSSVNVYFGRENVDYETVRNILVATGPKQASSETDGTQNVAGIDLYFAWPKNAWLFGADISIDYVDTEIDAFKEVSTLGNTFYLLSYPEQKFESLTVTAGFEVAYNASLSWGVLVPQGRIAYVRETENESRDVTTILSDAPDFSFSTTTDNPDKQYFVASIGASAVLGNDWQLFADATTFAGNDLLDSWAINLGVHKQF